MARLSKIPWKVGDEQLPYIALDHFVAGSLRINSTGSSNEVASAKWRFSHKDFLFGKLRPYFRKLYRPDFDGVCSTDIWVVSPKKGYDKDFLFYFFANQKFVDLSYLSASGTRMPRADWDFLKETEWNIPPLPAQKAIAEVLSSLDDKIDLLHRQNKTLENMAQALFRQWFVEEADEQWEETKLLDVVELIGGGTPKTTIAEYWDGNIPWLSGGDVSSNHKTFVNTTAKKISSEGLNHSSAKLRVITESGV